MRAPLRALFFQFFSSPISLKIWAATHGESSGKQTYRRGVVRTLPPRLTRISVWKSSRGGMFSLRVSVRVCVLRAYRYLYGSSSFLTRCPRWVRPLYLLFSDTTRQCWIASGKPSSISSNRNLGGVHRLRRVDKLFYVYIGKWNESHV